MLDRRFQEDVPLQMFVFPVHPDAGLPATFAEFASIPAAPATLPPEEIAANRDAWISEWTELMLG
jgi:thiamine transport system substrate-binding protein